MPAWERSRAYELSQETPSIRLWVLLVLVVDALVLSGEVWLSHVVRTTPKQA